MSYRLYERSEEQIIPVYANKLFHSRQFHNTQLF